MSKSDAIYFSLIFFISCRSYTEAYVDSPKSVLKNNMLELNGQFSNVDTHSIKSLYNILFCSSWKNDPKCENFESSIITFEVLSKNRVQVQYIEKNKIIDSKILRGKYKNGYFSVRRKINSRGIPFIYYKSEEVKIIAGITKANDLILKIRGSKGGGFLIFNNGVPIRENYAFKKLNL